MASASVDHTARLWSTSTRKPFGRVLQHASVVSTVAFSLDGQLVATGGREHMIFLWDILPDVQLNITSYINQLTASSDSLSASSTPAPDELLDGTGFPSETAGSRDTALPIPASSNHESPSLVRIPPPVELPVGF
ncbi:hypothetical protein P692DRAFT_20872306 [Suillus brevipes Sb2]|nr:hypothetical protein P692DRAFT_20872306 [Suillus brevipes Sb2]